MSAPFRVYAAPRFEEERLTDDPDLDLDFFTREEMAGHGVADLAGYDALVTFGHELTADAVAELADGGLRYVMRPGAGYDTVDLAAATEHGVVVNHAPQGPQHAVAEGTVGLMIACARAFHVHNARIRENGFGGRHDPRSFELGGSTVGIVGLGLIGRELAALLAHFDAEVVAYDPYVEAETAERLGVQLVGLDELLSTSDFVSIHVPLTGETHHMLGPAEFERMKETAFLVNASRGGIYPDAALAAAIREGEIAGAAVDVFEGEPDVEDSPLLALDETEALLTPHVLGPTEEALGRVRDLVYGSLQAMKAGGFPPNVLNPDAVDGEVPDDRLSPSY